MTTPWGKPSVNATLVNPPLVSTLIRMSSCRPVPAEQLCLLEDLLRRLLLLVRGIAELAEQPPHDGAHLGAGVSLHGAADQFLLIQLF